MASEPSERSVVAVGLPEELHEWLDEQARTLEVDRETLLVQLLASYRTAHELDVDGNGGGVFGLVDAEIDDSIDKRLDERLDKRLDERLDERLEERVDGIEETFQGKLEDVRDRVVQVKREVDAKAPAEHDHDEFGEIAGLDRRIEAIEDDLEEFRDTLDTVPELDDRTGDIEERLDEAEDRLQTLAWVVSDLREVHESDGSLEAVDRIKHAAAKADIDRANCENCSTGVELSLLTEPECPHCSATVTDVEPASGWFGKPTLLVASQLESGEES